MAQWLRSLVLTKNLPGFAFQHPHGGPQPLIIPIPGVLMSFSYLQVGAPGMHMVHIHTWQNTHTHKLKTSNISIKSNVRIKNISETGKTNASEKRGKVAGWWHERTSELGVLSPACNLSTWGGGLFCLFWLFWLFERPVWAIQRDLVSKSKMITNRREHFTDYLLLMFIWIQQESFFFFR